MITDELISYITKQKENGLPKESIRARLLGAGWENSDIAEGLSKVFPEVIDKKPDISIPKFVPISSPSNPNDSYREPVEDNTIKEFIPSLKPKPSPASNTPALENKQIESLTSEAPVLASAPSLVKENPIQSFTPRKTFSENFSNNAVLSSYPKDYISSMNNGLNGMPPKKSHAVLFTVIILFLLLCGGGAFAYTKGFFKLPFNVPFVKKDPIATIFSVPQAFKNTTSYTSDVAIVISFPSVSTLIDGLLGGISYVHRGTTADNDSITLSGVLKTDRIKGISDLTLSGKSTLIDSSYDTEIIASKQNYFVNVPNFSDIAPSSAPKPGWVTVLSYDMQTINSLLPGRLQGNPYILKIQEILAQGVREADMNKLNELISSLISSATVSEKDSQVIHGVSTLHYGMNFNHDVSKPIVANMVDVFIHKPDISDTMVVARDNVLSGVKINSIDIWVGKSDMLPYKLVMSISMPLDHLIGSVDGNVDNTIADINITLTPHDFNAPVTIVNPEASVPSVEYINEFKKKQTDMYLEKKFSILSKNANLFFKQNGNKFGTKVNNGNCLATNPQSFWSSIGHKKGTEDTTLLIQNTISELLSFSGGQGMCYSNQNAFAFALVSPSNPSMSLCVDNTGVVKELTKPSSGPICK